MAMPAIDADLVQALVAQQHPDLAHLPIREFAEGWDNRLFRLGEQLTARLPRRVEAAHLIDQEHRWLPMLTAGLPDALATSAPLRAGRPGCGYPWSWSIGPWLPGEIAAVAPPDDPMDAARQLGAFVAGFHRPAPPEAPPNPFRGGPLASRAPFLATQLDSLTAKGRSLPPGVTRAAIELRWAALLSTPPWEGPALWLHGDLHPANLLVHEGRLSAVLDFGDLTAGDPATDLGVAWQLLPASARPQFRAAAGGEQGIDDATWARGQGWALAVSVAMIGGSPNDDAPLSAVARRTIAEIVLS